MAKKKNNTTVVNNIDSVNLEIDYDKLAEAIVKAQQKVNDSFSVSRETMKFILTPTLWILAFVCVVIAIAFVGVLISSINDLTKDLSNWLGSAVTILISFFITLFSAALAVFLGATAKEIDKETDRQYVASMFSNIVAIVALIVALIALVKGVG